MTNDAIEVNSSPDPFQLLQFRVAEVFWEWKVWKQLFVHERGQAEEVYRLMNQQAPSFFSLVQRMLLDDVVVRICKLADPAQQCGRTNLTLVRMVQDAANRLGQGKSVIDAMLAELYQDITTLRQRRNRLIAHEDWAVALRLEPPDAIQFKSIERALELATAIMTRLHPDERGYGYDSLIANGDGESLIQSLRWAEKHVQEATARGQRL